MRHVFIASLSVCLALSVWSADVYAAPTKKSEQQEKLKELKENEKTTNKQLGQASD